MATILIGTADLEQAGDLRAAFQPEDSVEFITRKEDVRAVLDTADQDQLALILTGDVNESAVQEMVALTVEDDRPIPIVALLDEPDERPDPWSRLGPDEAFVKPVDSDEVVLVVHRLIERKRLQHDVGIVGRTEAIREVVERIAQIAPVGSTVLITGESGTGKELVARGLHRLSPRRGKPFIAVNIAALPETLLESELFGHEKGAFTGANSLRKGMFELAHDGTIFLDEIAEMPPATQTRLLRVLEQREFMRVGGSSSIHVDVRVIAATNRDLRQAVALNEFRRDLYYRLNVLHIDMPALRSRREDIPLLVHEFIREFSEQHQREFRGITSDAMEILVRYDWPGNVRELRNLVESMVVLAPGSVIRPEDIPPDVRRGAGRTLLPARAPASQVQSESPRGAAHTPEMEFIFRTLVELKLDVEDIRREFEDYKRQHPELIRSVDAPLLIGRSVEAEDRRPEPAAPGPERPGTRGAQSGAAQERPPETPAPAAGAAETGRREEPGEAAERNSAEDAITFTPGMTMQELERDAIIATLKAVDGNRRRASEKLGIGERTLYRKLKEYEIDI